VCPIDEVPPTYEEILGAAKNRTAVDALKVLCGRDDVTVTYLPGNHDMTTPRDFMEHHFPGIVFCGGPADDAGNPVYKSGQIWAEHGHYHAMFNAQDLEAGNDGLPIGYFLSRFAATVKCETNSSKRRWWTYFDDLFEVFRDDQTLTQSAIEAVVEEAGRDMDVAIRMGPAESMSARDVRESESYGQVYQRWKAEHGVRAARRAIKADTGMLDTTAKRVGDEESDIILFGHSHGPNVLKSRRRVFSKRPFIYGNCGAWCEAPKTEQTFIETEEDPDQGKHFVRLKYWDAEEQRVFHVEVSEASYEDGYEETVYVPVSEDVPLRE